MTVQEMKTLLGTTGYPVAYYQWDPDVIINGVAGPPSPPYLVFWTPRSNNFSADGKVYKKLERYQIELYTDKKDPSAEVIVENVLDGAGLYWEKSETYIDSEQLYQIIYESEA